MVLIQRVFVVCGRVARAVADSYRRAASPASTDDLTVEPRGELDRRRRTRSRGSFGALTLILQQVKRQVQESIQKCDSRVHSPSGGKSSLVPLVKTLKESVFCVCGDFSRPPPRPSRSRLRRRRVCVCVCYNGGGARFSTPSRRIHRTSSRASGSRAAAVPRLGLNRRSVTSRDGYIRP